MHEVHYILYYRITCGETMDKAYLPAHNMLQINECSHHVKNAFHGQSK